MKKLLALALALILALSLAACGNTAAPASESEAAPESETAPSESAVESAAPTEMVTLTVGASPAPHAQILEVVKDNLAEQGIDLKIVEFTDYVLPNEALSSGDLDANYFQHQPYLDTYNAEHGSDIISAAAIHYEPLGVYPGRTATLDAIADGAEIAIPNDGSNEARALYLLEALGLIKVDKSVGYNATVLNITENPKNLKITETAAEQIPLILPDVDFGVINGNYAISAGIADTVLETEAADSDSAKTYANIIAVLPGHESDPAIVALIAALKSDEVKQFINDTYGISVVPMF